MAKKKRGEEGEMTLMGHLNELRSRLFRAAFSILITSIVCFVYSRKIFDYVILSPKKSTFVTYDWLCKLGRLFRSDGLCFGTFDYPIVNLKMSGQFMTDMSVSFFAGIIIAFPYILYQLWSFIKPALRENERKHSKGAISIMSFLFFLGILFGYFIIVPLSVHFLGTYQVSGGVANQFQLDSYISVITTIAFGMGVVFELPILMFFLTKIGIVKPSFLRSTRKYALLVIVIVAAIITPPDVFSQLMVSAPLYILYEVGILVSARAYRKKLKEEEEEFKS